MKINLRREYNSFPLKDRLSYEEFRDTLLSIFQDVRDRVLDGDRIQTPLGTLRISVKQRNFQKLTVNMPASLKYRQQLINEGKTPLKGDNGGVPWYVYNTDSTFYHWNIGNNMHLEDNGNHYRFYTTKDAKSMLGKKLKDPLNKSCYEKD